MNVPSFFKQVKEKSETLDFNMPSDILFGSLLQTLVCSKPQGRFLELGTGTGLSLSWIIAGMDDHSTLISLDNEPKYLNVAKEIFENDKRISLILIEGATWIENYSGAPFDLIFADTWPGKFSHLKETLALVKKGGFYVIDDLNAQPNWPEGHSEKVEKLMAYLESREDFNLTKLDWSTGIIIMSKK